MPSGLRIIVAERLHKIWILVATGLRLIHMLGYAAPVVVLLCFTQESLVSWYCRPWLHEARTQGRDITSPAGRCSCSFVSWSVFSVVIPEKPKHVRLDSWLVRVRDLSPFIIAFDFYIFTGHFDGLRPGVNAKRLFHRILAYGQAPYPKDCLGPKKLRHVLPKPGPIVC